MSRKQWGLPVVHDILVSLVDGSRGAADVEYEASEGIAIGLLTRIAAATMTAKTSTLLYPTLPAPREEDASYFRRYAAFPALGVCQYQHGLVTAQGTKYRILLVALDSGVDAALVVALEVSLKPC
jgi:hypothetical protein